MVEEPLPAAEVDGPLKGQLLIAAHALADSNFVRTVVFIVEHNDDGALGVVVNRPSERTLAEDLPEWAHLSLDPPAMFYGGPVQAEELILGFAREPMDGSPVGPPGLVMVSLNDEPSPGTIGRIRAYSGYAGWEPGQLENEIYAGAWYVEDATVDDVLTSEPERLWLDLLRRRGGVFLTVPEDPTLN